jgi:hypothetical protein
MPLPKDIDSIKIPSSGHKFSQNLAKFIHLLDFFKKLLLLF